MLCVTTVKAVIFDLYGVLGLNGWQAFKAAHFAHKPEEWERLRYLGQRVDAGEAEQEEFVTKLVQITGENEATIRYQFEHTQANVPLLLFINTEIRPNFRTAILSNASHDVFSSIFSPEQLGLFDVRISSYYVGLTKPDPAIFRLACEHLGVEPAECVMVDDKAGHLASAEKLGMKTVLYTSADQAITAIREAIKR